MRYILFLMLFLHSFAHTEEESPQLSVLSTAEELASTHRDHLIGGLVSPISGQLILQETDLIAQGAQDVSLTRRYLPPYMPCSLSEKPLWEEYNFANYTEKS